jgi:signal transduction histidine kinase
MASTLLMQDYTFENVGISLWKEDFTAVALAIENLKRQGVTDFRDYFNRHPAFVKEMVRLVRINDVNQMTLRLFGAEGKVAMLGSLERVFTPEADAIFIEELMTIVSGEEEYSSETVLLKLNGERMDVLFSIAFPPDLSNVVVSIMDISARKRAEDRLRLLQEITAAFSQAITPEDVAKVMMDKVVPMTGGHVGTVGMLDGNTLHYLSDYGIPEEIVNQFRHVPLDAELPIAEVVRKGQPEWIESLDDLASRYPAPIVELIKTTSKSEAVAALPLIANERPIGAMVISFPNGTIFDTEFREFLTALSHQCAIALERAKLYLKAQEIAAVEERQRLARDLHDAVSQTLFSSTTIADSLPFLMESKPERAVEHLKQMVILNRAAMAEMRNLLLELRPEAIVNESLPRLFEQLLNAARGRKPIDTHLLVEGEGQKLPAEVQIALFRITQEAINNALKHSRAKNLTVRYVQQPDHIVLTIEDDGAGFIVGETSSGMGLNNLRERAANIGASLTIESHTGSGTTITVEWGLKRTKDRGTRSRGDQ